MKSNERGTQKDGRPETCIRQFLREIPGGDRFPGTLPLEDEIAQLAHRPPPSPVPGDKVGMGKDLLHGIRRSGGKADPAHDRDIDDIVTHERHLIICQTGIRKNLAVNGQLVKRPLENPLDPEFRRAIGNHLRRAARDDPHLDAGPLQELDAMAVLDVEELALDAVGIEDDPAVGHDAIHVEEQEVPGMGAFSLFTDPEGRMMGLWKAAEKQ